MELKLKSMFDVAEEYLAAAEGSDDLDGLWQRIMVDPYWAELARGARFPVDHLKPEIVRDLAGLRRQIDAFKAVPFAELEAQFKQVVEALPFESDGPMTVLVYPICHSDLDARERQKGVYGTCVFQNIMIHINPLVEGYRDRVPLLFAHEYQHCVWNNYWCVESGLGATGSLLEEIVKEGEADLFAAHMFPEAEPSSNKPFDPETGRALWARVKPHLETNDVPTRLLYIHGDPAEGLPKGMGYSFGDEIVRSYLATHDVTHPELIKLPTGEIFRESGVDFA